LTVTVHSHTHTEVIAIHTVHITNPILPYNVMIGVYTTVPDITG